MTKLMVSSPAELLSAVPFLVGFHPAASLVVVGMHGPRITFAVRTDLPGQDAPEHEARAAILHLATVVLEQQVEAVTIIGYGDKPRATPAVLRISDALRKAGVAVVDELRVTDGRYWSCLCEDAGCCPTEGRPCESEFSIVATEATFAGAVALPSREALAEQLASVTGDDREAMTAATARAVLRLAALAAGSPAESESPAVESEPDAAGHEPPTVGDSSAAGIESAVGAAPARPGPHATTAGLRRPRELDLGAASQGHLGIADPEPAAPEETAAPELLSDEDAFFTSVQSDGRAAVQAAERAYGAGGRLADDDVAWLGLLLLNMPVRDYAWMRSGTQEWELALWSDVMRRVEPRYLPAPASLLAFVAWRMGLGPLAGVATESALRQDPDYPLAHLMQAVLGNGMSPSMLDGWPAVQGLDPGLEPVGEDPAPTGHLPAETPDCVSSTSVTDSAQAAGPLPRRIRSAAAATGTLEREGPGTAPAGRAERPHKIRRASPRRL